MVYNNYICIALLKAAFSFYTAHDWPPTHSFTLISVLPTHAFWPPLPPTRYRCLILDKSLYLFLSCFSVERYVTWLSLGLRSSCLSLPRLSLTSAGLEGTGCPGSALASKKLGYKLCHRRLMSLGAMLHHGQLSLVARKQCSEMVSQSSWIKNHHGFILLVKLKFPLNITFETNCIHYCE